VNPFTGRKARGATGRPSPALERVDLDALDPSLSEDAEDRLVQAARERRGDRRTEG
jgi:hypothetical protein